MALPGKKDKDYVNPSQSYEIDYVIKRMKSAHDKTVTRKDVIDAIAAVSTRAGARRDKVMDHLKNRGVVGTVMDVVQQTIVQPVKEVVVGHKFKRGDRVRQVGTTGSLGKVTHVLPYNAELEQREYRINNQRHRWPEKVLELVPES